ncbi:MAG TPA: MATE family efflux transporter [Bacteroidales bacterium]|nr:MATE family efflux transporter [Bacteroidales bacterium]
MKDLTVGNESRVIFYFALPMLFGNIFQQLYNIVDSIIVGNYIGKEALAAVGASFPVIFVLISLIIGVSMGSTIIISQFYGAKDYRNVKKAIDSLLIFLIYASVIITVVGLIFSKAIFRLMGLPDAILADAVSYFNIIICGIFLAFGYNAISSILRGLGDSKTPLYFLIVATLLNIILVVLFVGVFKWGIKGSAVATLIAQGVAFILAVIYLNRFNKVLNFSFTNIRFDKTIFFQSLKIGIPAGLQQTFIAVGMVVLQSIVNGFGTETIAAYIVAGRIDSFAMQPAMNFSMALSAFVGQNIGARKLDRVRKGLITTLLMTSVFSVATTFIAIFFGSQLISLFNQDVNVINTGHSYLIIVCSFYLVFSTMLVIQGVIRGAGDTLVPMLFTLISLVILRLPIAYFLSRIYGPDGIWWSIPIAWTFGMIASGIYYLSGKWKHKIVTKTFRSSEN